MKQQLVILVVTLTLCVAAGLAAHGEDGELLYNGIRLPKQWPPNIERKDRSPRPVPYLEHPPAVIPIDVGRQLFVDHFLIESTTLKRQFHYPQRYEGNPILKPETPVELNGGKLPLAAMISDGVWFDPKDRMFKMWYQAGWRDGTMLALSQDGLHWTRPNLDVAPGTNRVLPERSHYVRHGTGICLDPYTTDPQQRFKMLIYENDKKKTSVYTSPDGIHWDLRGTASECGDNATMFYNPFRQKWVYSIRVYHYGRARNYREHADFLQGMTWEKSESVPWAGTDELDLPDPDVLAMMPKPEQVRKEAQETGKKYEDLLKQYRSDYGDPAQLYNLDAIAYESLMLGVFSIHRGPHNRVCAALKRPKLCDLELAYSRDGFHWHRPDRTPFLASTRKEDDWDRAYLHIAVGVCTIVGDKLYFYYSGEYHLFYMFDKWGHAKRDRHKCWGHAISRDLIAWEEQPPILDALVDNKPGSGSGVVDWNNSSGLRSGAHKTLLVFYTDYRRGSCIAYSNDRGRTWVRHARNPVLPGVEDIRDPTVFWYSPAAEWRMVRYEKQGFAFYGSTNLVDWTYLSRVEGFYECPDFVELPVQNSPGERRWVLIAADTSYVLGSFDGRRFTPLTEKLRVERASSLYATQTWKKTPEGGAPAIQMGWLRYPKEPRLTWYSQMSFPCELTLRNFPEGVRLCRLPIDEINNLRVAQHVLRDLTVSPGQNPLSAIQGDLFDIRADIEPAGATAFGITARGETVRYSVADEKLSCGRPSVALRLPNGRLHLQVLLDRSSIEVFPDQGQVSISKAIFPKSDDKGLGLFTEGGDIRVISLQVNRLESVWLETETRLGRPRAEVFINSPRNGCTIRSLHARLAGAGNRSRT